MTRRSIESIFLVILLLLTFFSATFKVESEPDENENLTILVHPQVVFDGTHGQIASLWDTGFHGLSHLVKALIGQSYYISSNTAPFLDMISTLSKNDVLVMGIAKEAHYSSEEINAIVDFVDVGGGLLIIGEHDNFANSSNFQNPLASHFGMTFNSDRIYDTENYNEGSFTEVKGKWIIINSSFFDLDDICFYFCSSMNLSANAEAILMSSSASEIETEENPFESTPGPAVVGAKSLFGEGRVVGVSDSQFLWNGDGAIGLDYGDNKILAIEMIAWLSNYTANNANTLIPDYTLFTANSFTLNLSVEGTTNISVEISGGSVFPQGLKDANGLTSWEIEVENDGYIHFSDGNNQCFVRFFKSKEENKSVLFLENHYCRKIDDSWSGLLRLGESLRDNGMAVFSSQKITDYTRYDCIIIPNPLEKWNSNEVSQLSKAKKVLLIGEDCSSIDGHDPYLELLRENGYKALDNPMSSIANAFNVDFTNHAIYDPTNNGGDPFWPKISLKDVDTPFVGYKSAVVLGSDTEIIAKGHDTAWGEELREGITTGEIEKNEYDLKQTSLILSNFDIMAIGDLDPFSNQHMDKMENQKIVEVISNWIKNEAKGGDLPENRTFWLIIGGTALLATTIVIYMVVSRKRKY